MSDDTLVDQTVIDQHVSKGTNLGVLTEAFDKAGVFYGVHHGENGGMVLYIEQNFGNTPYQVCEMKFDKHGDLFRVDGMGI